MADDAAVKTVVLLYATAVNAAVINITGINITGINATKKAVENIAWRQPLKRQRLGLSEAWE